MPSSPPPVSRRRVLAAGATLALFGAVASACGTAPPAPDALEAQVTLARRDAGLAAAAAGSVTTPVTDALRAVAERRQAHARVLTAEINRLADPQAESTTAPTEPAQAGRASVADVVAALQDSAQRATDLATSSSGYRAGLLGSIAAACTVDHTVTLAPKKQQ